MYITQFGGYVFPDEQLELNETAGASRRGARQALGGAGGSYDDMGLGADPLAEDAVNKNLTLEGSSAADLRTQFDALLGEMMTSQQDSRQGYRLLIAQMPDGSKRCTWAKCVECRARWDYWNINEAWLPVSITWARAWPVWVKHTNDILGHGMNYFGDHLGDFDDTDAAGYTFGWGSKYGSSGNVSPLNLNITSNFRNLGNAVVNRMIFEFSGQVANPKIYNPRNGHSFQYAGTLATGDRLTLYTQACMARKNGLNAWASITLGPKQVLPMALEVGDNDLILTHDGTGTGWFLRVWWADAWM